MLGTALRKHPQHNRSAFAFINCRYLSALVSRTHRNNVIIPHNGSILYVAECEHQYYPVDIFRQSIPWPGLTPCQTATANAAIQPGKYQGSFLQLLVNKLFINHIGVHRECGQQCLPYFAWDSESCRYTAKAPSVWRIGIMLGTSAMSRSLHTSSNLSSHSTTDILPLLSNSGISFLSKDYSILPK